MAETFAAKTLRELTRILFARFWMILLIVAATTSTTYVLCRQAIPVYRSTVTLIFKQPVGKNPVFQESSERTLEVFVKAQQQIVMSDLVLARTKVLAESPDLRRRWYALREREEEIRKRRSSVTEPFDPATAAELEKTQQEIADFLNRPGPGTAGDSVADRVARLLTTQQRALLDFRDDVTLKTPGGEQVAMTESFQISVDRPAPLGVPDGHLLAMHHADILADMYMVRFREFQQSLSGAAGEFMKRVVEEHNRVVERAKKRLDEFIARELDAPGDVAILEQLLKSGTEHGFQIIATRARETKLALGDQLARARSLHDLLRELLPAKAFEPDGPDRMGGAEVAAAVAVIPPEVLEANIIVNRLTQQVQRVEARHANLATQFTPANRAIRDVLEEIERTKRLLLAELVAHTKSLGISIESLKQRLAENETSLKNVELRLDKINRKLTEYQRLKNNVTVAQQQHQDLLQEQVNAFTADERARAAITIRKLDRASRPAIDKPAQPLTLVYTFVAAGVGLLISLAYAFLADHFDHTLRTIQDAERFLGVPVIGSVSKSGRAILV